MISRVSKTDSAVLQSLDLKSQGVDVLFAQHRDRLKRMPPNEKIVEGRAAIEKFWKAAMDSGIKTVELKTTEVEGLGESAVEVGSYTLYGKDGAAMDRLG
jgi:ketosteroid isomerase-like protein